MFNWFSARKAIIVAMVLVIGVGWFFLSRGPEEVKLSGPVASPAAKGVVFLVPGYGGSVDSLDVLANGLKQAGWKTEVLAIGDGHGDLGSYGKLVAERVRSVPVGVPVSLVGYSAGGVIVRSSLTEEGVGQRVGRLVTVASPHHGTRIAGLGVVFGKDSGACPLACQQLAPDSEFLSSLPSAGGSGGRVLSIYAGSGDDVVTPIETSILSGEGVENVNLEEKCRVTLDHGSIVRAGETFRLLEGFLLSGAITTAC